MKTLLPLVLLTLSALPAAAIETCDPGTAVITPDGNSATIVGAQGDLCQVQAPHGAVQLISPTLLMADFGMVDTGPVTAAAPAQTGLMTGYYICGEVATGFEVELAEGGHYTQQDVGEGKYTSDDHSVTFTTGPLKGRAMVVQDGFLALPASGGNGPSACELIEE